MLRRAAALGFLLLASPVAAEALPATLFEPGVPSAWGVVIYRIPALVRTARGTLVAIAEARTTDRDCTFKFLAFRRSTDNGTTWSPTAELYGRALTHGQGAGNPAVVFDAVTSTIVLHGSVNAPGFCNPNLWTFHLDDGGSDGATWGAPRNISASLGAYAGATPGPGTGAQIPAGAPLAGRLIIPAHWGAYRDVVSWFSDDHGATWTLTATPLPGLDEVAVAALPSGELLLNARTDHLNATCDCRAVTTSRDGGATWALPVRFDAALVEPVCQASLVLIGPLRDAPAGALFFSNPASRTARVDLTVRRSDDGGGSWPRSLVLAPGDADGLGYSCLAAGAPISEADGSESGAILFEAPAGTVAFARFPVALPPAPPPPPPPVVTLLKAADAAWVGRYAPAANGSVRFDFPGVTATFAARNATTFTAVFSGACAAADGARLESAVDGGALDTRAAGAFWVLPATPAAPYRITLARALDPAAPHTLALRLADEARWAGCAAGATLTLLGVETDGAALPRAAPAARRLEFVGDSITAGFGTAPPCAGAGGSTAAREDASRTAALTVVCPALGADCALVAVSGDTVITPPAPAPAAKPPLPLIYNRSLTYDPASAWNLTARAPPHASIINLGTNDLAYNATFAAAYVAALADFVVAVSAPAGAYAGAPGPPPRALLWCGPITDAYCAPMGAAVRAAVARGADAAFLGFVNASLEGCDGHPGAAGQREIGAALLPLVRAQMGW